MIKRKKKEITLDDLAGMVQRGFSGIDGRMGKMEEKMNRMDKKMNNLERGQEDIKLRVGEVAYRFELKELESRVETLERKLAQ